MFPVSEEMTSAAMTFSASVEGIHAEIAWKRSSVDDASRCPDHESATLPHWL